MTAWLIRLTVAAAVIAGIVFGYTWWRNRIANEARDAGRAEVRAEWSAEKLATAEAQASDRRQQNRFNDAAAGKHAAAVDQLSNQLGVAREKISTLSGRQCLDASTVRVLNAIGSQPGGAAAGESAGAAEASASDQDVGTAIATCRSWYGTLESQLNQILDIEDRRHPPEPTQ